MEFPQEPYKTEQYKRDRGCPDSEGVIVKHVEMIIDYTTDGTDFQYNDNHGVLVRCRDCKHFKNGHLCEYFSQYGTIEMQEDDYCSRGEK